MSLNEIITHCRDFFQGNVLLNAISLLLAILGIVFSIIFYLKSIRTKKPKYAVRTINLIKEKINKIDTVEILYNSDKISNLSISKIALWNDGKDTISASDIAAVNKLKITIEDPFQILDCEIIYQKNTANNFEITRSSPKNIEINFDFFDFEEGIVLQVFHTGNASQNLKVEGTIKTVKKIVRTSSAAFRPRLISSNVLKRLEISPRRLKLILGMAFLSSGLIFSTASLFVERSVTRVSEENERLIAFLVGTSYIWYGYALLKRRIPKGFDIFHDEF